MHNKDKYKKSKSIYSSILTYHIKPLTWNDIWTFYKFGPVIWPMYPFNRMNGLTETAKLNVREAFKLTDFLKKNKG